MADATKPFVISPGLARLTATYPSPQDLLEAAAEGQREKAILARLWISEGIPFAFKECPGLYEQFRASLAERLEIDAKEISVAGSGRLGYSLAPDKWGDAYRPMTSDLDWFAVSEGLFERLCEDFERWCTDYDHGEVRPQSRNDQKYWQANRTETPNQIARGFVDSKRVPNREQYGVFLAMNRCLHRLRLKLQKSEEAHGSSKQWTLRCYRNWQAYERQMNINLQQVVKWARSS